MAKNTQLKPASAASRTNPLLLQETAQNTQIWTTSAPPSEKTSAPDSEQSPAAPQTPIAATATPAPLTKKAAIDPEAFYAITLAKVATAFNQTFRPMHAYVVKGKVVTALGDAIKSYEASDLMH